MVTVEKSPVGKRCGACNSSFNVADLVLGALLPDSPLCRIPVCMRCSDLVIRELISHFTPIEESENIYGLYKSQAAPSAQQVLYTLLQAAMPGVAVKPIVDAIDNLIAVREFAKFLSWVKSLYKQCCIYCLQCLE